MRPFLGLLESRRLQLKTSEIEAWALRAIERVEQRQQNEDSRVELKADWPDDPERAARRITGHANALRGEPILWLIGVDENDGVKGASQNNLANWWQQVKSQFDAFSPELRDILVSWKGQTVVALYFTTERVPYVVKNPVFGKQNGGPVKYEIPWRDGTATRSATHSDLILLLSPLSRPILKIEIGKGRGFVNQYPLAQPSQSPATGFFSTNAYYARVKVVNVGRCTARNAKGYLANIELLQNGSFQNTEYADFMRLVWSHHVGNGPNDLLPNVPYFLDIVSTRDQENRFFLEIEPKTKRYDRGFAESGTYRLTIRVFAEDAEPSENYMFLHWSGKWNAINVFDETELENHLSGLRPPILK